MITIQIITSIALILLVLIQSKSGGLATSVANSFSAYRSRRGVEKGIFILTVFFGIVFTVNSLLLII
ncbi:preprotein translocase subunit SecG [Patescibacteria group bacterium]|nr:preprotein translocase subunit SecG [Patescibacteria group bacterium]